MSKKKIFFFRNGSLPVPRALRMMRIANDLNHESIFIGAKREEKIKDYENWEGFKIYRVGEKYPLLNGRGLKIYIKYTVMFARSLYKFFKKENPDILVASDFEVVIPAIIYSITHKKKLIYNIHDNLAQRYNVSKLTYSVLNLLEGIAVLFSDSSLVPEDFRKKSLPFWCQKKINVVKNIPGNIDYQKPKFENNGKIKLFYGGWLNENRGLDQMIELVNRNDMIELELAGPGSSETINKLKKNKKIKYLGYLSHSETLKKTADAHFIPVFYNPITPINRYAASNKLAETMAIGRPLLVNNELIILKNFINYNFIITKNYNDIVDIGDKLIEIYRNKKKYENMCLESRKAYNTYYSWDEAKAKMIEILTI